jgi:Autoinducer binding domain.
MGPTPQIERHLADLSDNSPSGFAIAFHIRFTTPAFLFQTYAQPWLDLYSAKGLVMHDPIVKFGFTETGWARWSDLARNDPADVLGQAAAHGLRYGLAFALEAEGSRSLAGLARPDREFTDDEIARITGTVTDLHLITLEAGSLSPEANDELKRMSVKFTHPSRDNA